jgi:hypothetical protein
MPRPRATRGQLSLEWSDHMRWEEIPAAVQAQVVELLAAVLVQAASSSGRGEGGRRE